MARTTRRPQMTDEERQAYNAEQRAKLSATLAAVYSVLHHQPVWDAMLTVAAHLPSRGPVNVVAITAQLPRATDVRSKGDWRKEGRYPAKGTTSLRVWTPVRRRAAADEATAQAPAATEAVQPEPAPHRVAAYKAGPCYDISQTAGEELTPAPVAGPDVASILRHLGESQTPTGPAAAVEALARQAYALLPDVETVPGQRAAEAASAAQIAARMLRLPPTPTAAPQLGGIVTGEDMTPAIKDAATRVITTGRQIAALAEGTQPETA
ncbi:hypothetical protein [Streptomyces sp. NPDC002913]